MREFCLLWLVLAAFASVLVSSRYMPSREFEYKRMLQEIVGGADSPYRIFPMAMFPDRLPAPVQTYW
ncbi:unnamed protein product [Nippostrongylus brasiliensis]|uniref:Uncharacterized protein n=1 Tax=Nippostrongylus brasiliensis TaxID=27835 RepID=A0A0N4XTP6_NIPBR|nr:hypothetical protein Q1695_012808 [Nippostrongylus brasiliensis]VDL69589.1 unnamed protein product [Nippostrongylus brasiliensis]